MTTSSLIADLPEPPGPEEPVWRKVHGVWRSLHGGFAEFGLSIEWHDFQLADALSWSESFHPNSLEICLNYTGEAELQQGSRTKQLGREQIALYTIRDELTPAIRKAGSLHRFVTLEISHSYLRRNFLPVMDSLLPGITRFVEDPEKFSPWLEVRSLPSWLLSMRAQLVDPPVTGQAREAWYQGKTLEILAQTIFRPDQPAELFCEKQKRLNRERIERVKQLIERDIENPSSLEMLAREVSCSPFYLSRLFAESTGVSIPKFLRLKRMERAAEMLNQAGVSVTEAAMAVGYSSLSAFHKAFVERFGVSPGSMGARRGR